LRNSKPCSRTASGPDHPHTLITRNYLASLSGEAQATVDQAIGQFQALLKDYLRVLGPDHLDTLRTRNNLATLGRVRRAGKNRLP